MGNNYVRYATDGGFVLVEIDATLDDSSEIGVVKAGLEDKAEEVVNAVQVKFEDALEVVRYNARAFARKVKDLPDPPDEMELGFGLKATGEGVFVVAKVGVEANYNIKLTWKKNATESQGGVGATGKSEVLQSGT